MDCCNYSEYRHHHSGGYYGQYPQHPYLGVGAGVAGYANAYYPSARSGAYPQYPDVRSHYNDLQQGFGLSSGSDHHYANAAPAPYGGYQRDYAAPAAGGYHALRAAYGYGYGYPDTYNHAGASSPYAGAATYQQASALAYAKDTCYDSPPYGTIFGPATDYVYSPKDARARKALRDGKKLKSSSCSKAVQNSKASYAAETSRRAGASSYSKASGSQYDMSPRDYNIQGAPTTSTITSAMPGNGNENYPRWFYDQAASNEARTNSNESNLNHIGPSSMMDLGSSSATQQDHPMSKVSGKSNSRKTTPSSPRVMENLDTTFRERSPAPVKDTLPLPGFQQAFGSTEIGRFSESFFTPTTAERESSTASPQLFPYGNDYNDYFDETAINLQLEVNATCAVEQSSALNSLADYTAGYQREIKCEDNY